MTKITVYDDTEDRLEKLADILDTTVAEVIDSLLDYEDELMNDYYFITSREFINLKKGDKIRFKLRPDEWVLTNVISDAFYNFDCDEPGWEVETEHGFLSIDNSIKKAL